MTAGRRRGRPALGMDEADVLAMAADAFATHGPSTSMSQVAEACGVAKTTLHDRFGTKAALFELALAAEREALTAALVASYERNRDASAAKQIHDGFEALFVWANARPGPFRLLFGHAGAPADGIASVQRSRAAVHRAIADIVVQRSTDPRVTRPVADIIAAAIVGAGEGGAHLLASDEGYDSATVTTILAGIFTEGMQGLARHRQTSEGSGAPS